MLKTSIVASDPAASAYDLLKTSIVGSDPAASAYDLLKISIMGSYPAILAYDLLKPSIVASDPATQAYDLLKTSIMDLSVVISSDLPVDNVELVQDTTYLSSVNPAALQGHQEWSSYRHVDFVRDVTSRELESTNLHPVLIASANVKRKLGSYFWNVAVIVLLILAFTFLLLAVDPTSYDRLNMIALLFLTAVAFKLVVRSMLPTITYLTYLDVYVIFSMIYLILQGAECGLMIHLARFRDIEQVQRYDQAAQTCLIVFLIFFHLVFIIFIQLTAISRRRRMVRLDHEFKENHQQKSRRKVQVWRLGMEKRSVVGQRGLGSDRKPAGKDDLWCYCPELLGTALTQRPEGDPTPSGRPMSRGRPVKRQIYVPREIQS
ncbi:gamma-aminobutyric acid receptor subunit gamma-2 [Plakobranchus ocellatus]|uniref:Gamma-aminobutyric acid receptor subunit gamma-2 n=1 Tax=Plakobranchus ocellatus TaxID=259542 RepID=A0AAV4DDG6_9GAST|nr:gamma-aminobutyric acid receptor subunit gamma-2 [Plakobranchus ocellatus]